MEAPSWSSAHSLDIVLEKPNSEPKVRVQGNVVSTSLLEALPLSSKRSKKRVDVSLDHTRTHSAGIRY